MIETYIVSCKINLLKELKDKGVLKSVRKEQYRSDDPGKVILTPIKYTKDQNRDRADDIKCRGSKYILGYTGMYIQISNLT